MPFERREPWFTVQGQRTVGPGTSYPLRRREFSRACGALLFDESEAKEAFDAARDSHTAHYHVTKRIDAVGNAFREMTNDVRRLGAFRVHGRKDYFDAIFAEAVDSYSGTVPGYVGYDGVDFYIAGSKGVLKSMIESLTVRDGGEIIPTPREVIRFYELGSYVLRALMRSNASSARASEVAIGRLWPDGSFTPEKLPNGNPVMIGALPTIEDFEETSLRNKKGLTLGEPVYRLFAQMGAATMLKYVGGTLPGLAPIYDANGLVLGRRLEFRHGSILPALGALRERRRSRKPRRRRR